ncbi:MAG: hypothetical protein MI975_03565 [Cytophagales bacterium]|nr:hypothetical protein [Cytophagales bacterium]
MKTTKAARYLAFTEMEFNDYHIETADKIYQSLSEGNIKKVGKIMNEFPSKIDSEFVHYAFMDKYGFGYVGEVFNLAKDYEELKKFGFY